MGSKAVLSTGPLWLIDSAATPTMRFYTPFLFFVASVVAQTPPPLPTNTVVNIQDYKSNVFDLAFGSSADLAPVQTLNLKPFEGSQEWVVKPSGTLFSVTNPVAATFLSFTLSATTLNPDCAQACGRPSVQTFWNITLNANKLGYNIIEPKSGLALMSWALSNSTITSPTTPVTLQVFDPGEKQQLFTFPFCEPSIWHVYCLLSLFLKISHLNNALFTLEVFGNVLAMDPED
ncbi:hypothetical protein B0H11DRAFT_1952265 [Mycena galericulata]|nr:hypothetical protein B0H11DRAFT_1952265 [Mycena galericulata]